MSIRTRRSETDAQVVERARKAVAAGRQARWFLLALGGMFFAFCAVLTFRVVGALDRMPTERLTEGFLYGVAIAIVWVAFGTISGLCIAKFMLGLSQDFRALGLLVHYHDLVAELPGGAARLKVEPDAPPNSRPPSPSPLPQSSDSLRTPSSGGCG